MHPPPSRSTAIVLTLLIKLGVIASLASITARFGRFKRLIFIEQRTSQEKLEFALFLGVPFALGVLTRLMGYNGADLSLAITVLGGLLGGTVVGLVVGLMVALPALLLGHELLAVPMIVVYALVAGLARWLCPDKEAIWEFSPFIDLSLYRSIKLRFKQPSLDWQVLFAIMIVVLEIMRIDVGRLVGGRNLFYENSPLFAINVVIVVTTVVAVGIPLKIWNSTRIEQKLEDQRRMLLQARMDALVSQINPHFLFNTLNTISSLIRRDPDTARSVLLKLSRILRRRLKVQAHFVPLKEEMEFIDDYLGIEVVRFGHEKLRVVKEIEPAAENIMLPSMTLQPLVENAIRHGLAHKIEGGTITLRASHNNHRLIMQVEDDGVGVPEDKREEIYASGIGISNVNERLRVLFADQFSLTVESEPGRGTLVSVVIPELVVTEKQPVVEPVHALD